MVKTTHYGVEVHRLADHWGVNFGTRESLLIAPADTPEPRRTVAGLSWNPKEILHISSTNTGLEANWDPVFRGFAVGRTHRHISMLPLDSDSWFSMTPSSESPFGYEADFSRLGPAHSSPPLSHE
jgi:hypothetical protein